MYNSFLLRAFSYSYFEPVSTVPTILLQALIRLGRRGRRQRPHVLQGHPFCGGRNGAHVAKTVYTPRLWVATNISQKNIFFSPLTSIVLCAYEK